MSENSRGFTKRRSIVSSVDDLFSLDSSQKEEIVRFDP